LNFVKVEVEAKVLLYPRKLV